MGASEDRIADKVAAKIASDLASRVVASLNSKLDELHERQAVQGQKLDFLCTSFAEDRVERKEICDNHKKWTSKIEATVEEHEAIKNRALGAAKVATVVVPIVAGSLAAKWEKIKQVLGW